MVEDDALLEERQVSGRPFLSVIMPVYNGARYLAQAVESLLTQTFKDFEFIIINDGSTDDSLSLLKQYRDERIILVDREHEGLVAALNYGLTVARGDYIVRMDCDDLSLPHRLEKQVGHVLAHPEVGILGTALQLMDALGHYRGVQHWPATDVHIRWTSLLTCPFAHPTVLLRRDILTNNELRYSETARCVEDYDLWTRVLKYTRGANLPEPLVCYRTHAANVSSRNRTLQLDNHDKVAARCIREELPELVIPPETVSQLRAAFVGGDEQRTLPAHRGTLAEVFLNMFQAFAKHHAGEPGLRELRHHVAWQAACFALRPPLPSGWVHLAQRLIQIHPILPLSVIIRAITIGWQRVAGVRGCAHARAVIETFPQ